MNDHETVLVNDHETIVGIPPEAVEQLHAERAAAEAKSQSATLEPEPAPASTPTSPAPASTPTSPVAIDVDAVRGTVDMLCAVGMANGGSPVTDATRQQAAELLLPAARKYGGEVPFKEEIGAGVALFMLWRALFPPPAAKPAARPPAKPAAQHDDPPPEPGQALRAEEII